MEDETTRNDSCVTPPSYPGSFESCRAVALAYTWDYAECLIKPPGKCPYRQAFASRYLCSHPNHAAIVKLSDADFNR